MLFYSPIILPLFFDGKKLPRHRFIVIDSLIKVVFK